MCKHLVEGISSICDVDVVANESKYSLRKNGENWRYFRQHFLLYTFAMENAFYLIIDVLDAPNSHGHDVPYI